MRTLRRALANRSRRRLEDRRTRRRRLPRGTRASSAGFARTRWGTSARRRWNAGVAPLRGARHRRLGTGERSGALPLQELRAHVQRPDEDADGGAAQEGAMARPRPGDDRGNQRGEGRRTLPRPPHHGLPLATPVSRLARAGQAQDAERHCRGGRDVHPRIVQGPQVRSSPPAAQAGRQGQVPGLFFENIPILVARDREGATTDAVLPNVDRASIAAALDGVVTPANRFVCDGGKAIVAFAHRAKSRSMSFPRRASPAPRPPTSISTTSTPITAGSRNGCAASTASPPRTCPTISDGDERSRHGETRPLRKTGSSAPSGWGLINR